MIAWPCRRDAGINGRRNTSHPDPAVLHPPDTTPESPLTALNGGSARGLSRSSRTVGYPRRGRAGSGRAGMTYA
jgi:hypothetical protein